MEGSTYLHNPNIETTLNEENPFFGYVNSSERALELVRDFENATSTKFTVYTKTKTLETPVSGSLERKYSELLSRLVHLKTHSYSVC